MDNIGLRTFQDLKEAFILPGYSFFLHLQFRLAVLAYEVPWDTQLSNYPMMEFVKRLSDLPKGLISVIYKTIGKIIL